MKTILITNDDGIRADGLVRLAAAAQDFGEVWVVAPDGQRSAASHGITLHGTVEVVPCDFPVPGVHAHACTGTPADCVRTGSLYVLPGRPDAVLSGINRGYNVASDIQYSGTCGAAFEGAFQGIPSIALSEAAGDCHAVTDYYLHGLLEELLGTDPGDGRIVNVNLPGCPLSECRGILRDRTVSRGAFYRDRYRAVASLPRGGVRLGVDGLYNEDAEEGTDCRAVEEHYISVGIVLNIGSKREGS